MHMYADVCGQMACRSRSGLVGCACMCIGVHDRPAVYVHRSACLVARPTCYIYMCVCPAAQGFLRPFRRRDLARDGVRGHGGRPAPRDAARVQRERGQGGGGPHLRAVGGYAQPAVSCEPPLLPPTLCPAEVLELTASSEPSESVTASPHGWRVEIISRVRYRLMLRGYHPAQVLTSASPPPEQTACARPR